MGQRTRERVADILATHRPPPLSGAINAGIDKILAAGDAQAGQEQTNLM